MLGPVVREKGLVGSGLGIGVEGRWEGGGRMREETYEGEGNDGFEACGHFGG